jgi:hypothetical protein
MTVTAGMITAGVPTVRVINGGTALVAVGLRGGARRLGPEILKLRRAAS